MGLIVIIPLASLAVWSIFKIFHQLKRGQYERNWWNAFRILALAGLALGIWFAFFLEYRVADKRIDGFPIPLAISNLNDGIWVKNIVPAYVRLPGLATNIASGVALFLAPIAAAAFFKENRRRQDHEGIPRTDARE